MDYKISGIRFYKSGTWGELVPFKISTDNVFNLENKKLTELLNSYVTTEQLETNVDSLINKSLSSKKTLSAYGITDAYTKQEVDAKIITVYRPKGSVSTYSDLTSKESTAQVGDVWDVKDTGMNYAWTSDSAWDALGFTIDLTNYWKKDELIAITTDEITSIVGS